jgi:hypothetical protein
MNAGIGQFACWNFGAVWMILFIEIGKSRSKSLLLQNACKWEAG